MRSQTKAITGLYMLESLKYQHFIFNTRVIVRVFSFSSLFHLYATVTVLGKRSNAVRRRGFTRTIEKLPPSSSRQTVTTTGGRGEEKKKRNVKKFTLTVDTRRSVLCMIRACEFDDDDDDCTRLSINRGLQNYRRKKKIMFYMANTNRSVRRQCSLKNK